MPDPNETTRLLDLVCARLCHDLGGLIGTVGNAMEMVAEDRAGNQPEADNQHEEGGQDKEIVAFAVAATRALTQRLRLLRAACTAETEPLRLSVLHTLVSSALEARRIALDTAGLPAGCVFSPGFGRVVVNVLLLAHDSLPRGGTITVMGRPGDLVVRIEGPGAGWPVGLMGSLRDAAAMLDAAVMLNGEATRAAQAPLTVLLALSLGVRLSPVFGPAAPGAPLGLRLQET